MKRDASNVWVSAGADASGGGGNRKKKKYVLELCVLGKEIRIDKKEFNQKTGIKTISLPNTDSAILQQY